MKKSPLSNILMMLGTMVGANQPIESPRPSNYETIHYKKGNSYWRKEGNNKPVQISKSVYNQETKGE